MLLLSTRAQDIPTNVTDCPPTVHCISSFQENHHVSLLDSLQYNLRGNLPGNPHHNLHVNRVGSHHVDLPVNPHDSLHDNHHDNLWVDPPCNHLGCHQVDHRRHHPRSHPPVPQGIVPVMYISIVLKTTYSQPIHSKHDTTNKSSQCMVLSPY